MPNPWTLGVLAAAGWALVGLWLLRDRTRSYGARALHAPAAGEAGAGVRYAFTQAMRPGAKESVREHLPSYVAGLAYHGGIFTGLGLLVSSLLGLELPRLVLGLVQALLGLGLLGGASLLLKRLLQPELRGLSHPDDYLSNLLPTAFLILALTGPVWAWRLSTILLLLYVPLGKIRHCLFFFVARRHLGAFFGRRGVFPQGDLRVH
jgi:hypothetical protein